MTAREERIYNVPFFQDKQQLVKQILTFEREKQIYLPNEFEIKHVPPYEFGEQKAMIGKIYQFYFIGISNSGSGWKYQAFEDEMKCKEFFIQLPNIDDKQLAFWLNNIELLSQ